MSKRSGRLWAALAGVGGLLAFGGLALAKDDDEETKPSGGGGFGTGGGSGGGGSGSDPDPGGTRADDDDRGGDSGGGTNAGGDFDIDNNRWKPGDDGYGKVFGDQMDDAGWPDDFDFTSNRLWISPDCQTVLEGDLFRPNDDYIVAIEPPEWPGYVEGKEVEATLAVDPENTIAGFVDFEVGRGVPTPTADFLTWMQGRFTSFGIPAPSTAAVGLLEKVIQQVSPTCLGVPDLDAMWGDGLKLWVEDFVLWLDLYLAEWFDTIDFQPAGGDHPLPPTP